MDRDALQALSKQVIEAALALHTNLGPGLLESSYTACLKYELVKRGLAVESEVPVPLVYDGHKLLDVGYRIDLLVCGELVIEVKALEAIAPVHHAQLLSYLRHSKRRLGLLLNFNVEHMREGIFRRVNRF
jgi:GxxExxY protein